MTALRQNGPARQSVSLCGGAELGMTSKPDPPSTAKWSRSNEQGGAGGKVSGIGVGGGSRPSMESTGSSGESENGQH